MMLTATEENRKALASLLGIDDEEAAEKLQTRVTITVADPTGAAFAADLSELIGKTLQVVGPGANPDIEIAVGGPASTGAPVTMTASMRGDGLTIGGVVVRPEWSVVPRFNERICACYASGVVVARAIGRSCPDPFGVDFRALGIPAGQSPIVFDDDVLAGCGGVGTAFLWALQAVRTSGRLTVVDGKNVSDGNLNRCFFYDSDDVGKPKAERLVARAVLGDTVLKPFVGTFHDLLMERGRIRRVFVTVDSRPGRRSIQADMPFEIFDASTTDVTAVVAHHHRQPTGYACLSCIYPHIPEEDARERDVAQLLGLTLDQVKRRTVDADTAAELSRNFGEPADTFLGKSMDSLAKARCGSAPVATAGGRQALAPFAFVSSLAGCLMVVDLKRSLSTKDLPPTNYLHLDPWRPPTPVRRLRARRDHCEFCGDPELKAVFASLWDISPGS
jgi:molybdopterin/thiamine biosynthesis adenylyltransferase